jgi:hypothetical protein
MSENEEIWASIIGGVVGAAIAAPSKEDKELLNEYKKLKSEINLRLSKIPILPNYEKLSQSPLYYNAFRESYRAYSYGLYRSSVTGASVLIETMLRGKFEGATMRLILMDNTPEKKKKTFYELIELAKKSDIISVMEYHLLHGLRGERNDSVHDALREINEEDAVLILQIAIRIINKLL